MTAENFDQVLLELYEKKPFQIFTVELNTGRKFEVDHRNALTFRNGLAVFIAPGNIPIIFDHESINRFIIAPVALEA